MSDLYNDFTGGNHPLLFKPMPGFDDGHYSNIDWGDFVVKDKLAYFPNGDIYDTRENQPCRWWPLDPRIAACKEDYSAWDDNRRCLEMAIRQAESDFEQDAADAYYAKRAVLVASAKTKLTEDEFDAVWEAGSDRDEE
jgi:hypothetical protein